MANYYGNTRTNYFHVKNEEKFRELMKHVISWDGDIEIWDDRQDENGVPVFAFGGYATIGGYQEDIDDTDDDPDYDEFINRLSECVAEDDAVIIFEVGNEKLRYFTAYAVIVTSTGAETIDLTNEAMEKGCELLKNPDWKTRCEY